MISPSTPTVGMQGAVNVAHGKTARALHMHIGEGISTPKLYGMLRSRLRNKLVGRHKGCMLGCHTGPLSILLNLLASLILEFHSPIPRFHSSPKVSNHHLR